MYSKYTQLESARKVCCGSVCIQCATQHCGVSCSTTRHATKQLCVADVLQCGPVFGQY
jgi:hypothetical protein